MRIEPSVARRIGWLIVGLLALFLAYCSSEAARASLPEWRARVWSRHDLRGPRGEIGHLPARWPPNWLSDFQLSYRFVPVESYRAGELSPARVHLGLEAADSTRRPEAGCRETRPSKRPVCMVDLQSFFNLDDVRELAQGMNGLGDPYRPLAAGIE